MITAHNMAEQKHARKIWPDICPDVLARDKTGEQVQGGELLCAGYVGELRVKIETLTRSDLRFSGKRPGYFTRQNAFTAPDKTVTQAAQPH